MKRKGFTLIELLVALNRSPETAEPLRSLIRLTPEADRPGLIASLLSLAACNTVRGIGQDIEKLGSTIEGAAKK